MAQKSNESYKEGPYHVTARSINKEWFSIPMDDVWRIFSEHLFFLHHAFNINIHSFVLMHNHYHLMVSTPECNLSLGMMYFHREVSRELNRQGNRINRTFAGRFFRCHIGNYHYFLNCYKYVYFNPVKAKASAQVESYPYSTLSALLGQTKGIIPLQEDTLLFSGHIENELSWLNSKPKDEDWEAIKCGLKKKQFKLPIDKSTGKKNRLEEAYL